MTYLAVILSVEVADNDGATAVELKDLVAGFESAAAVDVRGAGLLLEGCRVLADVFPPHVVQSAGAPAVDTLGLGGADDHVRKGRAVLEDEHGVILSRLVLVLADSG